MNLSNDRDLRLISAQTELLYQDKMISDCNNQRALLIHFQTCRLYKYLYELAGGGGFSLGYI